ncbi:armadillo-type protein [Mycena vitilis]|nr:armadillo-type protein [Mycena vitilis]
MPPFTRQRTLESIHSWWSDSNAVGATVSIHAMAKPLMRMMYHSQANAFIERNQDVSMSNEDVHVYLGYLDDTETLVRRFSIQALVCIASSAGGEQAVVDANVLDVVPQLLHSDDCVTQKRSLRLVGRLRLLLLSNSDDISVCESARNALSMISSWADGAKSVLEAGALDYVPKIFDSADADARYWISGMLANIVGHNTLPPSAGLALQFPRHLVLLLSDIYNDISLRRWTVQELASISQCADGARAVVNASVLDYVLQLLNSNDHTTQKWTTLLVGRLACQEESTAMAVVKIDPCERPVFLSNSDHIPRDGAQAVYNARALESVRKLFASPNVDARYWISGMVGNLVRHELVLSVTGWIGSGIS